MVVYIEYVIFDNMLVNILLTTLTVCALKKKVKILRILLGSLIGTVIAVLMPIIKFDGILLFLLKIVLSMVIVGVIARYRRFREFLIAMVIFYLVSFLFGGIVLAFCAESLSVNNYYYRTDINVGILALAGIIIVYILRQAVAYTCKTGQNRSKTVEISIILNGKQQQGEFYGLIDSGNNSYYFGKPIIYISRNFALKLNLEQIGELEVDTITGTGKLELVNIPELIIGKGETATTYTNQPTAIVDRDFAYYDAILHSTMEVSYVKEFDKKVI